MNEGGRIPDLSSFNSIQDFLQNQWGFTMTLGLVLLHLLFSLPLKDDAQEEEEEDQNTMVSLHNMCLVLVSVSLFVHSFIGSQRTLPHLLRKPGDARCHFILCLI